MVNAFALLASLVGVSAFSNVGVLKHQVSLKMSYENEIGALPPVGFWDPLGLSKGVTPETFNKRREAELKHGRVAMLAVVGYLVQEIARFPGAIDLDGTTFQSIPNGVAALSAIPAFGWFQIAASIGYWEIFGWKQSPDGPVGDFGFYKLEKPLSPEEKRDLNTKEIQNGRIAMLGIAELLTHDLAKPAGESLFTIHHF